MEETLIVTLILNEEAAEYFTDLRNQHFPAEINYLKAHLTLFHKLPEDPLVYETLQEIGRQQRPFPLEVAAVRSIGNGTAFKIESETLLQLHKSLQGKFKTMLIPQDQQRLWPHITIQNKVSPLEVNSLVASMNKNFLPFQITAKGFAVWTYLNGPWALNETYLFEEDGH